MTQASLIPKSLMFVALPLLLSWGNAAASFIKYDFVAEVTGMLAFTPSSTGPFIAGPISFSGNSIAVGDPVTGFFVYDTITGPLPSRDTSGSSAFVATINGITSVSNQDVGVRFRNDVVEPRDDFNFRSGFRDVRNVELVDFDAAAFTGDDLFQPIELSNFLDSSDRRHLQIIIGTSFNVNAVLTSLSEPTISVSAPTLPTGQNVYFVPSDSQITNPDIPSGIPEPTTLALVALGVVGIGYSRKRTK